MAAALGRIVDVPIVLRSLAADFYVDSDTESPLSFETDFILMLDSAPEKGNPGELVDRYYVPWWIETRPMDDHIVMNDTNIASCLDLYWEQIERTKIPVPSAGTPLSGDPSAVVLSDSAPDALSSRSADILLKLNTTPYTWNKEVNLPVSEAPCQCRLNCSVAMDSLAALQNLQVKVKGMTEATLSLKEDSGRRVSAFNQFYEAAVIKETTEPESGYTAPTPVPMPAPHPDPSLRTESGSVVTNPRRGPPRNTAKPKTRKGKKLLTDVRCPRPSNACRSERLSGFKICHRLSGPGAWT